MYNHGFLFSGVLGLSIAAGCGTTVIVVPGTGASGTGASGVGASGVGASGAGASGAGASGAGASGAGASGSSTSGTSGSTFSCFFTVSGVTFCAQYENLPPADVSPEMSACTSENGTAGTACPTANALGSCSETAGGISYQSFYYAGANITAAAAQMACTAAGGTWTPG